MLELCKVGGCALTPSELTYRCHREWVLFCTPRRPRWWWKKRTVPRCAPSTLCPSFTYQAYVPKIGCPIGPNLAPNMWTILIFPIQNSPTTRLRPLHSLCIWQKYERKSPRNLHTTPKSNDMNSPAPSLYGYNVRLEKLTDVRDENPKKL